MEHVKELAQTQQDMNEIHETLQQRFIKIWNGSYEKWCLWVKWWCKKSKAIIQSTLKWANSYFLKEKHCGCSNWESPSHQLCTLSSTSIRWIFSLLTPTEQKTSASLSSKSSVVGMGNGGESGTWQIGHSNLNNFAKYIILSNFGGYKGESKIVP